MEWASAAQTHRGNHRPANEDAVLAVADKRLWMVADGMGGHDAGDYASRFIAEALSRTDLTGTLSDCIDAVEDCLLAANDHLRCRAREINGGTIGSTIVVMLARGDTGVVLWAGDSRLYRVRNRELELMTVDHNPVADLLDVGGVSEEQAVNCDTHVITRAVGGQRELFPDIAVFDILPGDTLLLCTDGLYRELAPTELVQALELGVPDAAASLMKRCLAGPARDNVSVVVARASCPQPVSADG